MLSAVIDPDSATADGASGNARNADGRQWPANSGLGGANEAEAPGTIAAAVGFQSDDAQGQEGGGNCKSFEHVHILIYWALGMNWAGSSSMSFRSSNFPVVAPSGALNVKSVVDALVLAFQS